MQSRLFRNIRKSAVTIVFVEAIACALGSALKTRTRQHKNIHPSVVVVVKECAATARSLNNVPFLFYSAVDDRRAQTRFPRNIYKVSMKGPARGSRSR